MTLRLTARREAALSDPQFRADLVALQSAYEAGFSEASEIPPPKHFQFSFGGDPLVDKAFAKDVVDSFTPITQIDHREVMGRGNTASEALADWKSKLDDCPQSGSKLLWRVPPEIDCSCDFPTDKLIWKVYARLAVVP